MRFNSALPKALICENEEDVLFIINAMELVKKQESAEGKADLIIAWFKKNVDLRGAL